MRDSAQSSLRSGRGALLNVAPFSEYPAYGGSAGPASLNDVEYCAALLFHNKRFGTSIIQEPQGDRRNKLVRGRT
jgi:hypothetical protein